MNYFDFQVNFIVFFKIPILKESIELKAQINSSKITA